MKVKLIQAIVVGVFIAVGIVISEIEVMKDMTCDSLVIRGEDANILMQNGNIQFLNAKTDELAGYVSFLDAGGGFAGVFVSCRALNVTEVTDHQKMKFDNVITIEGNSVTIKEGGATRVSVGTGSITLHGKKGMEKDNVHASLLVSEKSGFIVLGNEDGNNKLIHTSFDDKVINR